MQRTWVLLCLGVAGFGMSAFANPYWDASRVPHDRAGRYESRRAPVPVPRAVWSAEAKDVLRVDVSWGEGESYSLASAEIESSGTEALYRRATRPDSLGSYVGTLVDKGSGKPLSYASVGTGMEFRHLTRAVSLRFPVPQGPVEFRLSAEHPSSGKMEEVFHATLDPKTLPHRPAAGDSVEVKQLHPAAKQPALKVNLYAEGYVEDTRDQFWQDAAQMAEILVKDGFPGVDRMEISAVFSPSHLSLGGAEDLGSPVADRDSFLGLFYPYWDDFGRWYNVVYPTRETHFRDGVGLVPYDYPVALVNDGHYWGVGNFNELTAVPTQGDSLAYLITHEFGHFFGLNEEYESGGQTELAFSPGIEEPWSQNITFLRHPAELKWKSLTTHGVAIPTPDWTWTGDGPYGAYSGGYAETEPQGLSHKPGLDCVMERGDHFCPICRHAIEEKVRFDLGE